ncbi:hypothetical protein GCM10009119_40720 [Algoriphagus jejuensis]|uniref:Uncharacterized protein n=1 Tax=Algoriphagus jejuensis TaxID=419934 RepID=A0ABN1N5N0_9BACT
MGLGWDQIAVGWKVANETEEFEIKRFLSKRSLFTEFEEFWIDKNGMACEDLQAADLDGDGKPEAHCLRPLYQECEDLLE